MSLCVRAALNTKWATINNVPLDCSRNLEDQDNNWTWSSRGRDLGTEAKMFTYYAVWQQRIPRDLPHDPSPEHAGMSVPVIYLTWFDLIVWGKPLRELVVIGGQFIRFVTEPGTTITKFGITCANQLGMISLYVELAKGREAQFTHFQLIWQWVMLVWEIVSWSSLWCYWTRLVLNLLSIK